MSISIVAVSFVAGLTLSWLLRKYALHVNLLDVPNQRSSHAMATPRGGGLGIVLIVLTYAILQVTTKGVPIASLIPILGGAGLVAIVGFIDDHRHVSAGIRFACHAIGAAIVVYFVGGLQPVQFGPHSVDLGVSGDILAVVFVVWFTNLFNFMDGIDGIAGVETVCVAGGVVLLVGADSGEPVGTLVVLTAATLGFLVWNWPPAKIFMGDVGSGFIGFLLASLAMLMQSSQMISVWPWLILAGAFFVDATVTLITRMIRREPWRSAHRSHAYQILTRKYGGHAKITIGVVAVNIAWLMPIAWFAHASPTLGWWLTIVAWAPLVVASLIVGAGRPD